MFWRRLRGVAFGTKSVAVIGRRGPAQIAIMMNWKTYAKTDIGMTSSSRGLAQIATIMNRKAYAKTGIGMTPNYNWV